MQVADKEGVEEEAECLYVTDVTHRPLVFVTIVKLV